MHRPTKAGNKLVFLFSQTELARVVAEAVERIEIEAYARGFADGERDEPDLDTPPIPVEDPE